MRNGEMCEITALYSDEAHIRTGPQPCHSCSSLAATVTNWHHDLASCCSASACISTIQLCVLWRYMALHLMHSSLVDLDAFRFQLFYVESSCLHQCRLGLDLKCSEHLMQLDRYSTASKDSQNLCA